MEKITRKVKDAEIEGALEEIVRNAWGEPILFTTTPTNATMKASSWGKSGANLYIKFADGVCLRIAGTSI